MREFILLALASLYTQIVLFHPVYSQDILSPSSWSCVDKSGQSYAPGAVVLSDHPCRECVCGARGNILCESLNKITECQPPDDAPCRNINGTTCCERNFSCDRLVSCSSGGVQYQTGDIVDHDNQKCQQCKCGLEGRVKCLPVASCGTPSWIAELGGTECAPVYAGGSCCPTDYLCKCVVFNETISRGPRNVARCTTCSCSRSGGVDACQPVTCKIPHKFSDKCRAIYRGDDCCPVDYDCTGVGKEKMRKNEPAVTVKPASKHQKWLSDSAQSGRGALVTREDLLPYGQNDFSATEITGPSGRSDEFWSKKLTPTPVLITLTPAAVTMPSRRLRGGLPFRESGNLEHMDAAWRTVNVSHPASGTEALLMTAQDGLLLDPKVMIVQSSSRSTDVTAAKISSLSTAPSTAHDALLKVFLRVAERNNKSTTVPSTSKMPQVDDALTADLESNNTMDTMEYDVALLTTSLAPKAPRQRHRPDSRSKSPTGSNPGVWTSLSGNGMVDADRVTTTPFTATQTTLKPNTALIWSQLAGTGETTNSAPLNLDFSNETEAANGTTDLDTTTTDAVTKTKLTTVSVSKTTPMKSSSLSPDVIIFASQPIKGNGPVTPAVSRTSPPSGRFASSVANSPRFSLDSPFSMSSADAGFLADDLSYKLFSVNFFRSPLGSFQPTSTARPAGNEASLNLRNASWHTDAAGQGRRWPLHSSSNLTGDGNATTESDSQSTVDATLANVTVPPDFQVVTFGALPRGGRKTAGKILFPPMPGGLGGGAMPPLPFETEVEFKGFGMLPEIEIKPLKGLAGLAGMAMMAAAGGGGGGGNLGGQLATGGGSALPGGGNGGGASRLAAAVAAQDAMEELAEGGTGDGALALAAAMMHNPHRPIPAKLMDSTKMGRITTLPPTVAIVYPNGTLQISGASQQQAGERSGRITLPEGLAKFSGPGSSRLAEFNSFFNSPNQNFNQFSGMNNPWSNPIFTGAAATPATVGATTDPAAATKDPFPFEAVADVIEEGRGPALTQLMGALQMMGRGMGGAPNPYAMMPQARGSMAGMNAMLNGGMGGMGGINRNFFSAYAPQLMGGGGGFGMDGMGGMGGMGGMLGNRGLFNLFAGSLSALESNVNPPEMGRIPGSTPRIQPSAAQRRLNPSVNSPTASQNSAPILRPMYKVGSSMTESPLMGLIQQAPLLVAFEK